MGEQIGLHNYYISVISGYYVTQKALATTTTFSCFLYVIIHLTGPEKW